jgi:hypothetical protein
MNWVMHRLSNRLRVPLRLPSVPMCGPYRAAHLLTPVMAVVPVLVVTFCDLLVYIVFVDTGIFTHPSTAGCQIGIITDKVDGSDFSSTNEEISVLCKLHCASHTLSRRILLDEAVARSNGVVFAIFISTHTTPIVTGTERIRSRPILAVTFFNSLQ